MSRKELVDVVFPQQWWFQVSLDERGVNLY